MYGDGNNIRFHTDLEKQQKRNIEKKEWKEKDGNFMHKSYKKIKSIKIKQKSLTDFLTLQELCDRTFYLLFFAKKSFHYLIISKFEI